ncbi:MAG TPA: helix-turn-helix domain-containing protein [Thermoplasmata archaeon]
MAEPLAPDTLATLRRLGMTEYEVRAYHALLVLGRGDGASVSRASGVPPTRVHSVLKELHRKDWTTTPEVGRPVVYVPRPPRERLTVEWMEATRSQEKAATELDLAYSGRSMVASSPVWFIRGEDAIAQRFMGVLDSARKQVTVTYPFTLTSDEPEFFRALAKCARHGRRVRMIVSPDLSIDTAVDPWLQLVKAGVELRLLRTPFRLIHADFETSLVIPPWRTREEMLAIWNPLRDFVRLLAPAYELAWEQAEPLLQTSSRATAKKKPHGAT